MAMQYLHDAIHGAKGVCFLIKVFRVAGCVAVQRTLYYSRGRLVCTLPLVKIYWGGVFVGK